MRFPVSVLNTPLGALSLWIDGSSVDYQVISIPRSPLCADLNGRFAIIVPFSPDGHHHSIALRVENSFGELETGAEPGEDMDMLSLYGNGVKLSIGMVCPDKGCDYGIHHRFDGTEYHILPTTQTATYVFGIAWLESVDESRDIQTWFGADPTNEDFKNSLLYKQKS